MNLIFLLIAVYINCQFERKEHDNGKKITLDVILCLWIAERYRK